MPQPDTLLKDFSAWFEPTIGHLAGMLFSLIGDVLNKVEQCGGFLSVFRTAAGAVLLGSVVFSLLVQWPLFRAVEVKAKPRVYSVMSFTLYVVVFVCAFILLTSTAFQDTQSAHKLADHARSGQLLDKVSRFGLLGGKKVGSEHHRELIFLVVLFVTASLQLLFAVPLSVKYFRRVVESPALHRDLKLRLAYLGAYGLRALLNAIIIALFLAFAAVTDRSPPKGKALPW